MLLFFVFVSFQNLPCNELERVSETEIERERESEIGFTIKEDCSKSFCGEGSLVHQSDA